MAAEKLDAFLVSSAANVRYLSGFTGSNGLLLVLSAGGAILFTDPRYRIQASLEADCRVRVGTGPLLGHVLPVLRKKKSRRVAFERSRMTFEMYQSLKEGLPLKSSAEPVAGWIELQRMIKSDAEIALIRHSVLVNSRAFERAVSGVRVGKSEKDLAAELDYQMRRLGAEGAAFETIVATGARTALPHAQPTAAVFGANSLILVDMGAMCEGYASDMTRMLFLGRPGSRVKRAYAAVLEAQLAGIAAVKAGVEAQVVDRAARRVLRRHGLERAFVHSTGHGLGLEIHEPPRLGKRDRTMLVPGMAITIEPGVYLEGFGGIRIEDTVVVTHNGCEVLTPTPKTLRIL
ncbi:MAG: aminopeptidase P family protein [Candidatus Solibacter usitatus]|nr:aminopeptidase P family protein [Candidatus Solibacter usitatus]